MILTELESKFKERIQRDLRPMAPEIYVLKTQERSRHGVPDFLICVRGEFVAMEIKREGEKATDLQEHVIKKIRQAGGLAFCVTPSQWPEVFQMIKDIK